MMPTSATRDPDSELLAGRYELGATLGRGGMADVYRARDRVLNRPVAVKVLREDVEESDRSRFVTEARTLARLSHSGLVTVLDAGFGSTEAADAATPGRPPGTAPLELEHPFLVMELVEGPTLARAIADGPLSLDEVRSVGMQVGRALAHVHAHDVVHRDVKPGNVLLSPEQRVKLADFGIARLLGDTARRTRTGHAIGTAAYIAPEQVTGQDVSGATDVYSLGLVLLEAITGRREYTGTPTEAALARLHREPDLPDELADPWRHLLADMTALEPAARPTAEEVAERLQELPTGPVPAGADADPDATRILTGAAPAAPVPSPSRPPLIDGAGDSVARQTGALVSRLRDLPSSQRAVIAVLALLVTVLVIAALVDTGDTSPSQIPDNTPTELRDPLRQLHDSVHGGGR